MKKKQMKTLRFSKSVISTLGAQEITGGLSGACTSSVNRLQCKLGCPESVYTPCG
ncbi:hypothetical protein [Kordia jejudonensis]|uniref:hypothetical protein n=1 Tax=Kordia jejudonensis TaxID=1348245 RepID=UPI0012DFFCB0|nr:hypothetical protein [Kordia jejudonensis]